MRPSAAICSGRCPASGIRRSPIDERHFFQDAAPSLLIEAAAEHPRALAACLVAGLRDTRARGREVSAWTAGAARAAGTRHALREALDDRVPRVRMAAAWALGRLRDDAARPVLERLAAGEDARLGAFAAEALARILGPGSRIDCTAGDVPSTRLGGDAGAGAALFTTAAAGGLQRERAEGACQ